MKRFRWLSLLALLGLACSASSGTPARSPEAGAPSAAPAELPAPAWLPPQAREMLIARMQRHGEEMMFLIVHVVVLDYDQAAAQAERIASEPRLGRPAPGEKDTLNALLPARFFELEDELRTHASSVAVAARAKDNAKLVGAYGQVLGACVNCHSLYLSPVVPEPGEGDDALVE